MDPEALSAALLAVVTPLAEARRQGSSAGLTAADLVLDRPKNRDHGDWASNAALKLAKKLGADPRFALVPPPQAYWLEKRARQVRDLQPSTYRERLDA